MFECVLWRPYHFQLFQCDPSVIAQALDALEDGLTQQKEALANIRGDLDALQLRKVNQRHI